MSGIIGEVISDIKILVSFGYQKQIFCIGIGNTCAWYHK